MASLTESYFISEQIMKDREPEKNKWYDRVYLCWEDTDFKKPNTYQAIKGFNCYRYNSFENADYAWNNHKETEKKLEVRHTMIPMCKWVPEIFDKYILNWKLRNMYWLGKNSFGHGYNKYGSPILREGTRRIKEKQNETK
jgi:hypothetical protein